jgi:glycosyltransferase involved in cell wall biosynthesis
MRVAFVGAGTTYHRESERRARLRDLAADLAARGHEAVWFCAGWWEGAHDEFEGDDGVVYHSVASERRGWRYPARLPGSLRSFDPDVVHAVGDPPGHVLAARTGAALAGAPLLCDFYDWPDGDDGALDGFLRRRALGAPHGGVTPSRTVKTRIRELGADGDTLDVVPTGVDFGAIRASEPEERADVVYARRLDDDANLESLLLALAEFRKRDWTAAVVGDGPERPRYERQAKDLRIADRVEFLGAQPVERRRALFRGAHVAVCTARRTPFPHDLARALACGCVGIVEYHADSAAHELIERQVRGFRVTDETELAAALASAADLERKTIDDSYRERFSRETVLERYLARYRELRSP